MRFGSDIRQFCSAPCLESYKKGARVCFHCQLDIKRLGNVILANIPAKQSPKVRFNLNSIFVGNVYNLKFVILQEFCSQDCVEMYVEQNLNQTVKSKSGQLHPCVVCGDKKPCFKEIVVTPAKPKNLKCCSEHCWKRALETQCIVNPVKCDTCTKYINLDFSFEPPAHSLATDDKVFGFCSATCKNVFVLKHRQILACVTCKVCYSLFFIPYVCLFKISII